MFGPDKYHGVILLPEGLIESIPEVYALLQVTHVCTFVFQVMSSSSISHQKDGREEQEAP